MFQQLNVSEKDSQISNNKPIIFLQLNMYYLYPEIKGRV